MFALAGVSGAPDAAATPTVRLFTTGITAGSGPTRIATGRDGNLWFTERTANKIGRISPSGSITEFPVDVASSGPFGIVQAPNGNLFFTETTANRIGRSTPAGGVDSSLATVGAAPEDIAAGPDGNMWFTEKDANLIGRVDVFLGFGVSFSLAAGAQPKGIAAGPDGVWFTEFGANKILSIDGTDVITDFGAPPTANSGPAGITAGPDGNMWFTEKTAGKIGRITPGAPPATRFSEFPLPGSNSQPESIVAGPDGNLWFTEFNASNVGRITPSGAIDEFAAGSQPSGITVGADGNVWFTLDGGNAIGRIGTDLESPRYADDEQISMPSASGPADPYPATIDASGLEGTVTAVRVRLNGLSHFNADAVEALLVGPGGQQVLLLADSAGGGSNRDVATGQVITFDDAGRTSPTELVSGIFKPIVPPGASASFAAPAPAGPYATSLATFNGTNPNGTWKLFVQADTASGQGAIARGWSLDIKTSGPPPVQVPGPTVEVPVPGPVTTVPGPTTTVPGPTTTIIGPPVADTTTPSLKLGTVAARMPQATFRKGFGVAVTPSEAVTLDVTMSLKPKRATLAAAHSLVLFERTVAADRPTTLAIKPSVKFLGRPKKSFSVLLRIVASDKAGNRTTVTKTITVDPHRKKRRR